MKKLFGQLKKLLREQALIDKTYIVGGTVRDLILNREIKDIDIVSKGDPIEIGRLFADNIRGSFVLLHEDFQVARVVKGGYTFDFSKLSGELISDDLSNRDFTINALAIPIHILDFNLKISDLKKETIDIFNGMDDINNSVIRMIYKNNLIADPLRLLRAHRFSASLGFMIENDTLNAISSLKSLIHKSAPERIMFELKQMLMASQSFKNINSMAVNGLLFEIFPELLDLKGVEQNDYHHLDAFEHTMLAYKEAEALINNSEDSLPYSLKFKAYLEEWYYKKVFFKLSILLHDIGKPKTKDINPKGKITFYKHEKIGAIMGKKIVKRLMASKKETEYMQRMISNHLRILYLEEIIKRKRAIVRFLRRVNEDIYGLIILGLADLRAKKGAKVIESKVERESVFLSTCNKLLEFYNDEFLPRMNIPKFITGSDLIDIFGLKPSPLFKEILNMTDEKVLEGSVDSKEEAIKQINEYLILRKKGK